MKRVQANIIILTIFFSFFLGGASKTFAQGSSTTRRPNYDKRAIVPKKQKIYKYIIVADTKNTLYGNKCATELTHRYGFEYLPTPKSQLITERESQIMFHNLFTNLSITLTRGPFWKLILKKRLKQCQTRSKDMNG